MHNFAAKLLHWRQKMKNFISQTSPLLPLINHCSSNRFHRRHYQVDPRLFSNCSLSQWRLYVTSVTQTLTPDLMHLFNTLGDTRQNIEKGVKGVVPNEIKALVSLCTLLNARSSRTTRLQLFLSLMQQTISCQQKDKCLADLDHAAQL